MLDNSATINVNIIRCGDMSGWKKNNMGSVKENMSDAQDRYLCIFPQNK